MGFASIQDVLADVNINPQLDSRSLQKWRTAVLVRLTPV
jgi:hypothetical protein